MTTLSPVPQRQRTTKTDLVPLLSLPSAAPVAGDHLTDILDMKGAAELLHFTPSFLSKIINGKVAGTPPIPLQDALLRHWLEMGVPDDPEAFVFAGETGKPLWVDFQVMRRTHASLSHEAGINPKVQADQRGHGLGVGMEVYTKTTTEARTEAARQLEESVLVN